MSAKLKSSLPPRTANQARLGELHPTVSKNEHEMFDAMLATTTASAVYEMKTELKDQTGADGG